MLDFEQLRQAIGQNVQKIRKEANLTQLMLSKKVEKSRFWLTAIETGSNFPTVEGLYLLADVLNCTVSDFLPSNCNRKNPSFIGPDELIKAEGTTGKINLVLKEVKNDKIRGSTRNKSGSKNYKKI